MEKKKRREYPQKQRRKSLPQSSSQHESGCQRLRWWLRVERYGLRKRLLHEGLSSRLDGGWKGKGSDKGGDGTEGKEKKGRERERERCTTRGCYQSIKYVTFPNSETCSHALKYPLPLSLLHVMMRSNCTRYALLCIVRRVSISHHLDGRSHVHFPCPY